MSRRPRLPRLSSMVPGPLIASASGEAGRGRGCSRGTGRQRSGLRGLRCDRSRRRHGCGGLRHGFLCAWLCPISAVLLLDRALAGTQAPSLWCGGTRKVEPSLMARAAHLAAAPDLTGTGAGHPVSNAALASCSFSDSLLPELNQERLRRGPAGARMAQPCGCCGGEAALRQAALLRNMAKAQQRRHRRPSRQCSGSCHYCASQTGTSSLCDLCD